jgi:HPt (histidine-containing phosphotransfer) domain-containing protein
MGLRLLSIWLNAVSLPPTEMTMNLSLEIRPDDEAVTESSYDPKRRPVDLAHLSRYTMGNNAIEREVLELFKRQTRLYLDRLSQSTSDDGWREAVRVLKESARSVGAWQLLKTAEAAEGLSLSGFSDNRQSLLHALADQIQEANTFIDSVL